jgi:hypothetical protein
VDLVQVDVVGAQPAQRVLDRAPDVAPSALGTDRRAIAHVGALMPELGREQHLVPASTEDLADQLLRPSAATVGLGRVQERDAGVDSRVDHRAGTG